MTREEAYIKLNEVFRDVFDDESIEVMMQLLPMTLRIGTALSTSILWWLWKKASALSSTWVK